MEVAEGDQANDKDVEVEVKENVEAVVQEDVELEIDQVEVGTVLLKRTLGVSFQLENNCESLFFLSFLLFFLFYTNEQCAKCNTLKREMSQLKGKVTRLNRKLTTNQDQWVKTFKHIHGQNRLLVVDTGKTAYLLQ